MGLANNITAVLNFVAFICSIPIVAAGIWLASKADNECIHLLRWPVLILGLVSLLVSLAGFVGAYWYKETLLAFYLCAMAILIAAILVLLVFAFIVTRPDGSQTVPDRGYKDYRLDGFSSWLRGHIVNDKNWANIKICLSAGDVCSTLSQNYVAAGDFFLSHISPLQSGCCKPPSVCGYSYVNPTMWVNPTNQMADADCYMWSNDQTQLCYSCSSCKAGVLGNLRREWRKTEVVLIVAVVVLIWVYIIACCAFKNAQTEDLFRRYKDGWI